MGKLQKQNMTTECGDAKGCCEDRATPWFVENTCTPEDRCTQRASVASEPVPRASLTRVRTAHAALAHVQPTEHRKIKWWDHGLWQPPRLMVEEDGSSEEERGMTWCELFFDLIFVTAIARLGEDLKESSISISEYIAFFLVLWTLWTTSTLYATRFHSDDLSNKLYFALFMRGVGGLAMHIRGGVNGAEFDNADRFAVSAAGIRFLTTIYIVRVGVSMPEKALHYSVWTAISQFSMGLVWLCVLIVPHDARVYIWWTNILLHYMGMFLPNTTCTKAFFKSLNGGKKQTLFLPLHLEHYVERHGLIMIIVLGETIDGMTQNPGITLEGQDLTEFYLCSLFGFVVVLCIKMLYFDVDDIEIIDHPLHVSKVLADLWTLSNPVLAASIAITGSGIDLLIRFTNDKEEFEEENFSLSAARWYASVGAGMTIVTIALRHALIKFDPVHRPQFFKTVRTTQIVANVVVGLIVCSLPLLDVSHTVFKHDNNTGVLRIMGAIGGALLLCVFINLIDECMHLGHFGETEKTDTNEGQLSGGLMESVLDAATLETCNQPDWDGAEDCHLRRSAGLHDHRLDDHQYGVG